MAASAKHESTAPQIENELAEVPFETLPSLDDDPPVADVIVELGPPRDPPLTTEARKELQLRLPQLRGNARLIALDRLAAASDEDLDTSDGDADAVRKAFEDLIAAPGFAAYAHADAVLVRAARLLVEHDHFAAAEDYVVRLIARYPKSPWIPDAQLMLARWDRDKTDAERYFDDAIAAAKPTLADYAHYLRLYFLIQSGYLARAIDEAIQLVQRNEIYREPVTLLVLVALTSLEPDEALARLADLDSPRLAYMSLRLAEVYGYAGKQPEERAVLADLASTASEPLMRCQIAIDMLQSEGWTTDAETMRDAAELARIARDQKDPRCRTNAESWLARQATIASKQAKPYTVERRDPDTLWQLAIAVSTNPEHKALELQNHALLSYELATLSHTAAMWWSTARAFDEAFLASQNPQTSVLMSAGADAAREYARGLSK